MDKRDDGSENAYKIFYGFMKGLEAVAQEKSFQEICFHPNDEEKTYIYLIFCFGALDFLCQSMNLSTEVVINIFEKILRSDLYGMNKNNSHKITQEIIRNTESEFSQSLLKKGAECLGKWMSEDKDAISVFISIFTDTKGAE